MASGRNRVQVGERDRQGRVQVARRLPRSTWGTPGALGADCEQYHNFATKVWPKGDRHGTGT